MDYRAELRSLVNQYLSGELDFDLFATKYGKVFIDDMPDSALTERELEVYGAIHEKAEWTSVHPSAEDRQHGWMDLEQFRIWLRERSPELDRVK